MKSIGQQWQESPDSLQDICDQYQRPVVAVDFQVSRRKRVHLVHAPGLSYPRAFDLAVDALDAAHELDAGDILIVYIALNGAVSGCRAILSEIPKEASEGEPGTCATA